MEKIDQLIEDSRKIVSKMSLSQEARRKLDSIRVESIARNKKLEDFGKQYQKLIRKTIAFYDPNSHIVFANKKMLGDISDDNALEVFIHEFVHAVSNHSVKKDKFGVVLSSGLKKQYFLKNQNETRYQALNEGYVQYLCNRLTGRISNTYYGEYIFVAKLVDLVGETAINRMFMEANYSWDNLYLNKEFDLACEMLDQGHYEEAWKFFNINIPTKTKVPEFSYVLAREN